MGKKNRAKQNGKTAGAISRFKRDMLKSAADLFKLCVYQPSRQEEWDHYVKIYNSVEDFAQRQQLGNEVNNKTASKPKTRSELIPIFQDWLAKNQVTYPGIEIKDFEDLNQGFGLIAKQNFEMKDVVVTIPRKVMLTYENAKHSYLDDLIQGNEVLSVMPNVCLALYLHCEKYSPLSEFKPYIDIIPEDFNTTIFFTPDELAHLKGSAVLSSAIQQFKSIVRQFSLLYQVFNGTHQKTAVEKIPFRAREMFSFEAYKWAVSAVTTRQNKIPLETACLEENECTSDHFTLALIPLWDMFNHDVGPMSTRYNVDTHHIECLAMRNFNEGEQVMICYGGRPNSELLIHNGFILTNSPFDKVKILLGVSPKDPLYGKKVKLLKRLNLEPSGQFLICAMDGNLPTSPMLLAFLRIFHMDEDQLDHWLLRELMDLNVLREVYVAGPVQFKNDLKMWEFLYNRVALLLRGFGANFEEDTETKLLDPKLSYRTKLAIQLRKEEYRVLNACVGFCQQFKNSLEKKSVTNITEIENEEKENDTAKITELSDSEDVKEPIVNNLNEERGSQTTTQNGEISNSKTDLPDQVNSIDINSNPKKNIAQPYTAETVQEII